MSTSARGNGAAKDAVFLVSRSVKPTSYQREGSALEFVVQTREATPSFAEMTCKPDGMA
eukprot:CAMPEP_0197699896 /NCGR_PEP_ID=MMETSP1338-20131121/121234_1 /TAXON_ID=43686 ORGANISM="Pelagodinium beii, Strain RCC1491" /NCGR_SAMPLE_ID=MMETSP1338 /ASSEMBLY_ACC=CAM_ASM_000754 /LENGTH=58 /DNA_ID=CAMNT_0043283441 /DNA_START=117 /DNA_END=289 /DNA_ORIENTATION=-